MPKALEVDHEQVKLIAIQVGFREAARQLDIPEGTVLYWAATEGWSEQVLKAQNAKLLLMEKQGVQSVSIKTAEAMVNMKEESKLYLSATLANTARALYDQEPDKLLKNTQAMRNAAATLKDLHPQDNTTHASPFQVGVQVVIQATPQE